MPPKKHIEQASSKLGVAPQNQDCYGGERLDRLLQSLERKIESARLTAGKSLPEKIWFKQQFAIGVNDVTRVLERKPPMTASIAAKRKAPCVELQIVLIASDCNPRWLSKHLPSLAMSRKIPVLFLKDNKAASLRLGQLVKLKTDIAIGVKAKGNVINQFLEEILDGDVIHLLT